MNRRAYFSFKERNVHVDRLILCTHEVYEIIGCKIVTLIVKITQFIFAAIQWENYKFIFVGRKKNRWG